MAEQVDAADLKSVGSNPVPVRFRPSAPIKEPPLRWLFFWYVSIGIETAEAGSTTNESETGVSQSAKPMSVVNEA